MEDFSLDAYEFLLQYNGKAFLRYPGSDPRPRDVTMLVRPNPLYGRFMLTRHAAQMTDQDARQRICEIEMRGLSADLGTYLQGNTFNMETGKREADNTDYSARKMLWEPISQGLSALIRQHQDNGFKFPVTDG